MLSIKICKKVLNLIKFSETIFKYVIKAENMSFSINGLHFKYQLIILFMRM
jgi:hypothetical protein